MKTNKGFDKNNIELNVIKPKKEFNPLRVVDLKTVIKKRKYKPLKYFVKPILPEGLTILAGKAKIKKSFFSFDMAISIALGKSFLGKLRCTSTTVYYIPLEDNFARIQRRGINMLGKCSIVPKNLIIPRQLSKFPRLNQGGLKAIETIIKERPDVGVIIIDTMVSFIDKPYSNSPNYSIDYDALKPLQKLAINNHVAIVLVHHALKSSALDPFDEIQGSMGTQAGVDGMLVMRNFKGAVQLCLRNREIPEETFIIQFDDNKCRWFLEGNNPEFGLGRNALAILKLFKDIPTKEFTFQELHTFVGSKNKSNTTNILKPFLNKKLIEHVDKNAYRLHPVTFKYLIDANSSEADKKE